MNAAKKVCIIGGGISGLATAYYVQEKAKKAELPVELILIEGSAHLGGKIRSVKENGFLCEAAANGFLDNKSEILALCRELGLESEMLQSSEAAKKRFLYISGKLHLLPESPSAFIFSSAVSIKGKLRALLEPFTRKAEKEDESIFEFASRHLGREVAENFVSSAAVGIFAGDAEKLSLKSCFPVMLELEKEGDGSLLKAMLRRMRKAKKAGKKVSMTGRLVSFKDGAETLIKALDSRFKGKVFLSKKVEKVERKEKGYEVRIEGEDRAFEFDAVVLASPAYASAEILESLDSEISKALREIPYAPASVVYLGYSKEKLKNFQENFGFLIPKKEKRKLLGCRFDSCIFPSRAPEKKVLLACILGGAFSPELALADEKDIVKITRQELNDIFGIEAEPEFMKVFRHEKAIPQYTIGHSKRVERIEKLAERYQGLFITGNALRGVSMSDCVKNSAITAEKVVGYLTAQ